VTLYEKVISASKPYFGPATESFIDRQCKTRLKIEPASIMAGQLAELAKHIATYGAIIMDESKAKELSAKISALR
jgi:hypothetical protein